MKRWMFYRRAGVLTLGLSLLAGAGQGVNELSAHSVAVQVRRGAEVRNELLGTIASTRAPSDALAIPVLGVEQVDLRDSFTAPRVGHVHRAIDIPAPRRTPVVAATDGVVTRLFTGGSGGLTVYQRDSAGRYVYYYAHLDSYAPELRAGKLVRRGEIIGFVGTSGNAPATFPHLHFAISEASKPRSAPGAELNPYGMLLDHGVTYRAR